MNLQHRLDFDRETSPRAALLEVAPQRQPPLARVSAQPNRALLAGSIGTAVVSGGLYALAFNARSHHTSATDIDTLDSAYTTNHAFVVSSAGTAAVAVGLGVSAFLVTSW